MCIDRHGRVTSVEVVKGPERLHKRIGRTLRRWRYVPYRRSDEPIPVCFPVASRLRAWK